MDKTSRTTFTVPYRKYKEDSPHPNTPDRTSGVCYFIENMEPQLENDLNTSSDNPSALLSVSNGAQRTLIGDLASHAGETVSISGWVDVRRDQGKMVFFDFRDMSGFVQGVALPKSPSMETAKEVRNEYVVRVTGIVNKRPDKNVQEGKQNGDIELEIQAIEILNPSEAMPFDISEDTSGIDEAVRAEYRYLDLRSKRMRKNMHVRSEFVRRCREFL